MKLGATFSSCRKYRYSLTRSWAPYNGRLLYILLNPSTADAVRNDPTNTRGIVRANDMGFGAVEFVNLFGIRSPYPEKIKSVRDPVGHNNDRFIRKAIRRADMVVCGWGTHGTYRGRDVAVKKLIRMLGKPVYYLQLTKERHPKHTLYISYKHKPKRWDF